MSRLEWILGGILALLLVIVALVAVFLWLQPDEPPAVTDTGFGGDTVGFEATSVFQGQTAQIAYALAQQQAAAWQGDAQLISATATWPQGASRDQMRSGAADWGFTFYAPSSNAIAVFSVTGAQANLVTQGQADNPMNPADLSGWQIDSPAVSSTLLEQGGSAFIDQEGLTTLVLTLSANTQAGRIEWFASLVGNQTGNSLNLVMNATTGEVIELARFP